MCPIYTYTAHTHTKAHLVVPSKGQLYRRPILLHVGEEEPISSHGRGGVGMTTVLLLQSGQKANGLYQHD